MGSRNINIIVDSNQQQKIKSKNSPALFLDRDGVIINDLNYIRDPSLVKLEKGIKELFSKTIKQGWPIIIVTNQSGIERGFLGWKEYKLVNNRMLTLLGKCNYPTAIYANSQINHKLNNCWRKPSPNMLLQASQDFNINLEKSILIGDRLSDVKAGLNAGLSTIYHTATGHGEDERSDVEKYIYGFSDKTINNKSPKIFLIQSLEDLPDNLFKKY